jgi:hypothetical protein
VGLAQHWEDQPVLKTYPTVSLNADGTVFLLRVTKDALIPTYYEWQNFVLRFSGSDCTESAYFENEVVNYINDGLFPVVAVGPPAITPYSVEIETPPVSSFVGSYYDPKVGQCHSLGAVMNNLKPAFPLTQLTFTPPFKVVMVP